MSRPVEFPLNGGGSIIVEVAGAGDEEPVTRGWREERQQGAPERAQQTFDAAIAKVRPAADALLATLADLTHSPDEVTVEFAVGLSARAGACIATLGSTANFKVTLTWRQVPDDALHAPSASLPAP